jgi:hypothetical protein
MSRSKHPLRPAKPTPHEAAILRRAAWAGGIIVTTREDEVLPVCTYLDGVEVRSAVGGRLRERDFARLCRFLVPDSDHRLIKDGSVQRWSVRKPDSR